MAARPALALCLLVALAPARAPGAALDERLVQRALDKLGRELDPAPEGKRVEEVLVVVEDIIGPDDPWPSLLNLAHATTRPATVRRELLLGPGDAWRDELAKESERNLRGTGLFTLARVVAARGRAPDAVALVVATRDLWSLRLNMEFNTVGALLQYLRVRPQENNVAGTGMSASLDLVRRLDTWSLGQIFTNPRVLGSRLQLSESAAVILNRETGAPEGSRASVSFGRPLYSLASRWAFDVSGGWNVRRVRVFRGAEVWQLPYPSQAEPTALVPYVYDARTWSAGASLTRSYGRRFKTNAMLGWLVYSRRYEPPSDTGLAEAQREWLARTQVPRSEDAAAFTAALQLYDATWKTLRDVQTFSLNEDWQLGHSLVAVVRWAYPSLWSPQPFAEGGLAARYRWHAAGNLVSVSAAARVRRTLPYEGAGAWVNRRFAAELLEITPPVGPGRFVARLLLDGRAADLDHDRFLLGGDGGLRGSAAGAFSGTSMALLNVEYRTRSVEFRTLHAGAVLFWDAGTAFDVAPAPVHTVGAGLRILLPQFDVQTLRIDFGWVVNASRPAPLDRFSASYGQVEHFRPSFLSSPLD